MGITSDDALTPVWDRAYALTLSQARASLGAGRFGGVWRRIAYAIGAQAASTLLHHRGMSIAGTFRPLWRLSHGIDRRA